MDKQRLRYETYKKGQEKAISDMIWNVFLEFEAPGYSEKGIGIFKEFINPQRLAGEIENNGLKIFCCFEENTIVGALALRNLTHISLLFVKKSHHKRGIAKELLMLTIEYALRAKPDFQEITVNSSPYAVEIYERLGFFAVDAMLEKDGILFMPMKKLILHGE